MGRQTYLQSACLTWHCLNLFVWFVRCRIHSRWNTLLVVQEWSHSGQWMDLTTGQKWDVFRSAKMLDAKKPLLAAVSHCIDWTLSIWIMLSWWKYGQFCSCSLTPLSQNAEVELKIYSPFRKHTSTIEQYLLWLTAFIKCLEVDFTLGCYAGCSDQRGYLHLH